MNEIFNVGLIQMSCGENVRDNLEKAIEKTRVAAEKGAQIICLQELFKSRYFCQVADEQFFSLAELIDEDNHTVNLFCDLAKELDVVLIVPLFEKRAAGIYHNALVVIDADGRYLGKY